MALIPLDVVREQAAANGAKLALAIDGEETTYAELAHRASCVARGLIGSEVGPGSVIAAVCGTSREFVVMDLAVNSLGMIWAPLNTRLTEHELAYQLQRINPRAVLYDPMIGARNLEERLLQALSMVADQGKAPMLIATEKQPGKFSVDDLYAIGGISARTYRFPSPKGYERIQFTSGTTSKPKAVALSLNAFMNNAEAMAEAMKLTPEDSFFSPLPLNHSAGYCTLLAMFRAGGTFVSQRKFDAKSAFQSILAYRCTALRGVDAIYSDLIEEARIQGRCPAIRTGVLSSGNEVIKRRLLSTFGMPEAITIYGMTETSGPATITNDSDTIEQRLNHHGTPMKGMEISIAAASAKGDAYGEILVRGSQMMVGYLGNHQELAQHITDGWFHTGDLGVIRDGKLLYLGRKKEMIRVGGENVSCLEVEEVLIGHPAVKQAGVFPLPDDRLGEVVAVAVVLRPGYRADAEALIQYSRERLASFKIPRAVYVVDALPLTESGKLQRHILKNKVAAAEAIEGRKSTKKP